jgi:hypothetical protein
VGASVHRDKSYQLQGEEYHMKILIELLNTLWKRSESCALRKRFPRGHKVFLLKETEGKRPLGD